MNLSDEATLILLVMACMLCGIYYKPDRWWPLVALMAVILLLAAGHARAAPLNICYQPMGRIEAMSGCDAQIQVVEDANPITNVAQQALLPGPVVLLAGLRKDWPQTVANFPALIAETRKYPGKFPWVYLYDEAGWCSAGLCWFDDEDTVLAGAALAHANGIKTLITILPDVILDHRFALKDINAFDGISIDVYPSMRPTKPDFGNCKFSDNYLENLFYCAVQKLRALGFVGKVGYIWQGVGMISDTHAHRIEYLTLQRQAINNAARMGADAVMSWGCYLGAKELAAEPMLVPLCGTQYEQYVTY